MRCFLAVTVPEEVRREVDGVIRRLRPRIPGARFVRTASLHLTLHFFEDLGPDDVLQAGEAARRGAGPVEPFEVAFRGLGAFPDPARPRVLWMGLERGGWQMASLHRSIGNALRVLGLPVEARPYSPHLTLARLSSPAPEVARILAGEDWGTTSPFLVREVVLFESRLHPGGAEHLARMSFPLGA
ncbi:RNA 2',3'-cyclic phosphodiesterase [Myxococcota bacterium]|nr:RNA 2',3'-cyclic phosphodiesterase [Myxococcota bacterium]